MTKYRVEVKIYGTVDVDMPDLASANALQYVAGSHEILNDPTFSVDYYTAGDAELIEDEDNSGLLPLQNLELKIGGMPVELNPRVEWPKPLWDEVEGVDYTELPDDD